MDPRFGRWPEWLPSFPRRRGDGPTWPKMLETALEFSPQARGWTVVAPALAVQATVFPAGAGMDRHPLLGTSPVTCFPRRRGDGPGPVTGRRKDGTFSPQARGWTVTPSRRQLVRTVFPAGAGMDPRPRLKEDDSMSFPRRRGDGPLTPPYPARPAPFSPQARGWTRVQRGPRPAGLVFPAGAGMDPAAPARRGPGASFPRRRGDGPLRGALMTAYKEFSPQARGWTRPRAWMHSPLLVFPAGAGMDPTPAGAGRGRGSFPRRRGDGPSRAQFSISLRRFSPQARGWTPGVCRREIVADVFPAGAGMDLLTPWAGSGLLSFPRRRGDGPPRDHRRRH